MQPIIPPVETALLLSELEGHLLRPSNKAENLIYDITAHECPNVMREIARLREISYREGGGATGKEMDIDEMDTMARPYHQLIVWDPENRQIVGGYRYLLGSEAEIRDGQPYITSAHLYHYSERFIREYLPYSVEFGRAFVQPMYQKREMGMKALFALDNIWDGIGALVYNHPEIRYMFGKVTIYPCYNATARELIYHYLDRIHDKNGFIYTYRMDAVKTEALSVVLKKDINNVGDIINNYDEIYILAETLAKETPKERTKRRKDGEIQDDPNFSATFGNFESDKCWGQIFVSKYCLRTFGECSAPMFADE